MPRRRPWGVARLLAYFPVVLGLVGAGWWFFPRGNAASARPMAHGSSIASSRHPALSPLPTTPPALRSTPTHATKAPATIVTAARPGVPTVALVGPPSKSTTVRVPWLNGAKKRVHLISGEGAGPGWCLANGGYPLGATIDGVYACGPSTGPPQAFDTSGFQCVELSERFLWLVYGKVVPKVYAGADFVETGHHRLHVPIGVPGKGHVPMPGDIVSLSGPTADPAGHTAVVSGVNVDPAGNGAIQLMEENGSLSGWDYIDVHHWQESFGDRKYYSGYFYYTNISWLKLAGSPPSTPTSALAGSLAYSVHPLGGKATEAAFVNDRGWATGMTDQKNKHHALIHRAIVYQNGHLRVLKPPHRERILSMGEAVNPHGLIAGWAVRGRAQALPYIMRRYHGTHWLELQQRGGPAVSGQALGVNARGAITGWVGSGTGSWTKGAEWFRGKSGYWLRRFSASRDFQYPIAQSADTFGDVIGTEMLGRHRTFAVLWTPDGRAHRLPSFYRRAQLDLAAAVTAHVQGRYRILSIAGSSGTWNGGSMAVVWRVRIQGNWADTRRPSPLPRLQGYRASSATGINAKGWVVGNLTKGKAASRGFLYVPGRGTVYLGRLVPEGGWVISAANSINASGEVAAEAYKAGPGQASRPEAVLLIPRR